MKLPIVGDKIRVDHLPDQIFTLTDTIKDLEFDLSTYRFKDLNNNAYFVVSDLALLCYSKMWHILDDNEHQHTFTIYDGFREKYEFCTSCNTTRPLASLWK